MLAPLRVKEGVVLTPELRRRADAIAARFFAQTGLQLQINDGLRTPQGMAGIFLDEIMAGKSQGRAGPPKSFSAYKRQDVIKQLLSAAGPLIDADFSLLSPDARTELQRSAMVAMTEVLEDSKATDDRLGRAPLTNHYLPECLDIASRGMSPEESLVAVEAALASGATTVLIETPVAEMSKAMDLIRQAAAPDRVHWKPSRRAHIHVDYSSASPRTAKPAPVSMFILFDKTTEVAGRAVRVEKRAASWALQEFMFDIPIATCTAATADMFGYGDLNVLRCKGRNDEVTSLELPDLRRTDRAYWSGIGFGRAYMPSVPEEVSD